MRRAENDRSRYDILEFVEVRCIDWLTYNGHLRERPTPLFHDAQYRWMEGVLGSRLDEQEVSRAAQIRS